MQKDAQLDPARSTIWLLCERRNGAFSKAVCIDALEKFDFRLCELSLEGNPKNRSIALYCRPGNAKESPKRRQIPVLLFCMYLNPREGSLEYIGSILANGDSDLHSICYVDILGLCKRLVYAECSFFTIHPEKHITKISTFRNTVKTVCVHTSQCVWNRRSVMQSGLTSGSVIMVYPSAKENVNADRIRQELQDLQPELPVKEYPVHAPVVVDNVR